ncbi:hypothetical protein BJ138DRAFT_1118828 [Hygrophoropsis aurantiaca]|uniref:Uncharacterized protein n=1 Tax=Hygrophoropsis aurantiaca TaxID=72124 RepID=A0ACB7ZWE4_9AGAM|nr:hypothetical protein BJ138DRAFT_1118828 [Hygrophoropsis aurantiaca]
MASPDLQQTFQAMKLDARATLSPVTKRTRRPKSRLLEISRPLRDPDYPNYCQAYGYYVSDQCLYQTLLKLWPTVHNTHNVYTIAGCPETLMSEILRMSSLTILYGVQPPDMSIPEDCIEERSLVRILTLFTDEDAEFGRRPSQKKVDRLSKLVEQQPRWWRTFYTRQDLAL